MYKYTTPTHVFKFPDDPSIYRRIEIIYAQRGEILLKKTEEDITFGENGLVIITLPSDIDGSIVTVNVNGKVYPQMTSDAIKVVIDTIFQEEKS